MEPLVEVADFVFDFLTRAFLAALVSMVVEPLVVLASLSLAGWVLLAGSVPVEPGGCAGGDDCGLVVPLTVGVVLGVVTWAEAAVALSANTAAKANTFFIAEFISRISVSATS